MKIKFSAILLIITFWYSNQIKAQKITYNIHVDTCGLLVHNLLDNNKHFINKSDYSIVTSTTQYNNVFVPKLNILNSSLQVYLTIEYGQIVLMEWYNAGLSAKPSFVALQDSIRNYLLNKSCGSSGGISATDTLNVNVVNDSLNVHVLNYKPDTTIITNLYPFCEDLAGVQKPIFLQVVQTNGVVTATSYVDSFLVAYTPNGTLTSGYCAQVLPTLQNDYEKICYKVPLDANTYQGWKRFISNNDLIDSVAIYDSNNTFITNATEVQCIDSLCFNIEVIDTNKLYTYYQTSYIPICVDNGGVLSQWYTNQTYKVDMRNDTQTLLTTNYTNGTIFQTLAPTGVISLGDCNTPVIEMPNGAVITGVTALTAISAPLIRSFAIKGVDGATYDISFDNGATWQIGIDGGDSWGEGNDNNMPTANVLIRPTATATRVFIHWEK